MNLKMQTFQKTTRKKYLFKEYVNVLTALFHLSMREEQIFDLILQINSQDKPLFGQSKNLLSTDYRRAIMAETKINKNNLSKYIQGFVEKGILIKNDEGGYELNPTLIPEVNDDEIKVMFIINAKKEEPKDGPFE